MKKTYVYPISESDIIMTFVIMGSSDDAGNPTGNPGDTSPTGDPQSPARKLYV